jgi:PBSX family phage terminase large subunit
MLKIKLLKKQLEFVNSTEKEVLYVGSKASGKSYALACKLYKAATYPNSFNLLTRKSGASIKSSTLRSLLYGEKDCPPVLIPGTYEYQESKNTIKINGGGLIYCCGFDDPLRIRSINASSVFIDEGIELDQDEYLELLSRIRNTSSYHRQVCTVTNPSNPNHFLYRRFFKENDGTRKVITAQLLENFHLPKDYIDEQLKLTGSDYNRYVMGEWCSSEGLVYKEFDEEKHVKEQDIKDFHKFIISVDVGYTNDITAILIIGIHDNDTNIHIFEEWGENNTPPTKIVEIVEKYYKMYPNSSVAIDPSAAGIRLDIEKKGIAIKKANNNILEGISRVKDLFINNRITISKNCKVMIKELYNYSYGDNDKPIDGSDHFCDSLKYGVSQYFDMKLNFITPTIYIEDDERDKE